MRVIAGSLLASSAAALSSNSDVSSSKFLHIAGLASPPGDYAGRNYYPGGGHTPEWYREQCTAIKMRCEDRKEAVEAAHASKVNRLEEEYKRESNSLSEAEAASNSAESTVSKQKEQVETYEERVKRAKVTYQRTKDCPAELRKLEEELVEMEARPNKSEQDIEDECAKKKEILKKQKCVNEYIEAKALLARREAKYSAEGSELSEDQAAAKAAHEAAKHQASDTEEAEEALDDARKNGPEKHLESIDKQCEEDMNVLRQKADDEVAKAQADYDRHAKVLASKQEERAEQKEDVIEQRKEVAEEEKEVKDAQSVYNAKKDCPAELEKARQELEALEAKPNKSEEDIDAECLKKKEILEKEKCVEEFYEAKSTLCRKKSAYSSEEQELQRQSDQAQVAKSAARSYSTTLEEFEKALQAAKESRAELNRCAGGLQEEVKSAAPQMLPAASAMLAVFMVWLWQ